MMVLFSLNEIWYENPVPPTHRNDRFRMSNLSLLWLLIRAYIAHNNIMFNPGTESIEIYFG